MKNKSLSTLLIAMMGLIVVLFWVSVYLGQDEFEAYQEEDEQEEEIEGLERTVDEEGLTIIQLSEAVQKNSGISTSITRASIVQTQLSAYGEVVSMTPLIEAKRQLAAFTAELKKVSANTEALKQQYAQLNTLNADDKAISDARLNTALMQLNDNLAAVKLAETNLATHKQMIALQWGRPFLKLLSQGARAPHAAGLLNHQFVLIRISLPVNSKAPKSGSSLFVSPIGNETQTIDAYYLAPAFQTDQSGLGETYYYSAPASALREGMRVSVLSKQNKEDDEAGSIIPNAAVIWYAGSPWVYVRRNPTSFLRKPIQADSEIGDGWFDPHFPVGTEIVTTGAQLLLSEEFKYIIQNENDD